MGALWRTAPEHKKVMMASAHNRVTVREVWQLALPSKTELVGGSSGLQRGVEWVATLRATFPLFGELGEGYIALADLSLAQSLDPRLTLTQIMTELKRADAVGLVVQGQVPEEAAVHADVLDMPLLLVAESTDLRALERDILRTLVDRQGQAALREAQVRQGLQEVFARQGLEGVLERLSSMLVAQVSVLDTHDTVISARGPFPDTDWAALDFPIQAAGRGLGRLEVVTRKAQSSPLDLVYAEQAAEICGIEILQRVARQETEERLGAELVAQLLDESLSDDKIRHRFVRLGYAVHPQLGHLVIAISDGEGDAPDTTCHELAESLRWSAREAQLPVATAAHRSYLLLFLGLKSQEPDWLQRHWPAAFSGVDARCNAGISRVVHGISGLRTGVIQAMEATGLGALVDDRHSPYHYEDLGLYRLLSALRDRDELRRFHEEMLGSLMTYDAMHETDLVHSLEVFFAENTNISRTSRALFVHRNTLNYRVQRIQEITGLDLDDPESRLALQLALKIHHLSR